MKEELLADPLGRYTEESAAIGACFWRLWLCSCAGLLVLVLCLWCGVCLRCGVVCVVWCALLRGPNPPPAAAAVSAPPEAKGVVQNRLLNVVVTPAT